MDIPLPFPRLTYEEAMNRFGSDKPDTRFGMELTDLGDTFAKSQFKVFRRRAGSGRRGQGDQREEVRRHHHRARSRN